MISAKIIQDSINENTQKRLTTLELEYPRFIHSEFMTHRVFSRNAASSRAIPVSKTIEQVKTAPACPVHWGANQPGMQAKAEVEDIARAKSLWASAAQSAAHYAQAMTDMGLHKQVANRILEPFVTIKVVVTSTEWENFFILRNHSDAQPEIHALAMAMEAEMVKSTPLILHTGEWHVPYVSRESEYNRVTYHHPDTGDEITSEEAIRISASCCAQVSYRKLDTSSEKADAIYHKLVASRPLHASPFEHQAMAMPLPVESGNFRGGWHQHRQDLGA